MNWVLLLLQCCRTDIDEARVISFLGVRTDRQDFIIITGDASLAMRPRITGTHNDAKRKSAISTYEHVFF